VKQPPCVILASNMHGVSSPVMEVRRENYSPQAWLRVLVSMHRCSKNPPFGRMATLACVALAFCLFAWGLQYKLSLYDPPEAASHHVPTAKLLSKNEQSSPTESPLVVRTRTSTRVTYTVLTVVFFLLFTVGAISSLPLSGQRRPRANDCWRLRLAHLRTHFVRPPPVLA